MKKEKTVFEKTVVKVGINTIIWNALLTLAKVVAGILAKSASLISDGVHSASDVFSTVIVIIGAKLSAKEADKEHPFGHERLESIASIILAMLLGGTAIILGYTGITSIITYCKGVIPESTGFAYIALGSAVASIVIKFIMYVYTLNAAKKIQSTALKADAYHHLSDSLSSIGSLLGIIGMMIGGLWSIMDPVACIIIALFVLKVAFDIAKAGIDQVVDKAAPEEFEISVLEVAAKINGILNINSLKTRQFGNKYYVEIEIEVDGNLTVREGHEIAKALHNAIESNYDNIKHCMVHVDCDIESGT